MSCVPQDERLLHDTGKKRLLCATCAASTGYVPPDASVRLLDMTTAADLGIAVSRMLSNDKLVKHVRSILLVFSQSAYTMQDTCSAAGISAADLDQSALHKPGAVWLSPLRYIRCAHGQLVLTKKFVMLQACVDLERRHNACNCDNTSHGVPHKHQQVLWHLAVFP